MRTTKTTSPTSLGMASGFTSYYLSRISAAKLYRYRLLVALYPSASEAKVIFKLTHYRPSGSGTV